MFSKYFQCFLNIFNLIYYWLCFEFAAIQCLFKCSNINKINKLLVNLFKVHFTGQTHVDIHATTKAILANHTTAADFFLDNHILNDEACYLSKYQMIFYIPFSITYAYLNRNIYLFDRKNTNQDKLLEIVDTICNKWNKRMIVYPEGTRNTTGKPVPLKYGVIKALYNAKISIQIMHVTNKHKILNEKTGDVCFDVICDVKISQQFDPKCYNSLDDFIREITEMWLKMYVCI